MKRKTLDFGIPQKAMKTLNLAVYLSMSIHERINAKSNFISDFQDPIRWPNLPNALRCYYSGYCRPVWWGKFQPNFN